MKKVVIMSALTMAINSVALLSSVAVASSEEMVNELPPVTVYKSPTCGCCEKWVDHLEENGFTVEISETDDIAKVKQDFGVPAEMNSCHTAFVGDYFVEGHVPADEIKELLSTYPNVRGIAVPGMPANSPGMEMPGYPSDDYEVISVGPNGETTVKTVIQP